jgi:actin-related protein
VLAAATANAPASDSSVGPAAAWLTRWHDGQGDHEHLAWSGGCLLPSVESYKELSIRREEWEQRGIMVLREKAFFPW